MADRLLSASPGGDDGPQQHKIENDGDSAAPCDPERKRKRLASLSHYATKSGEGSSFECCVYHHPVRDDNRAEEQDHGDPAGLLAHKQVEPEFARSLIPPLLHFADQCYSPLVDCHTGAVGGVHG